YRKGQLEVEVDPDCHHAANRAMELGFNRPANRATELGFNSEGQLEVVEDPDFHHAANRATELGVNRYLLHRYRGAVVNKGLSLGIVRRYLLHRYRGAVVKKGATVAESSFSNPEGLRSSNRTIRAGTFNLLSKKIAPWREATVSWDNSASMIFLSVTLYAQLRGVFLLGRDQTEWWQFSAPIAEGVDEGTPPALQEWWQFSAPIAEGEWWQFSAPIAEGVDEGVAQWACAHLLLLLLLKEVYPVTYYIFWVAALLVLLAIALALAALSLVFLLRHSLFWVAVLLVLLAIALALAALSLLLLLLLLVPGVPCS
ncbi:hypothetical protein T484DRAFT_1775376, partial [Baffinella frigidus]